MTHAHRLRSWAVSEHIVYAFVEQVDALLHGLVCSAQHPHH